MALFVVACGILLMLGGAVSLLLGFDIVMTERGAAMTIGGVVALSGGVIALGIGLALVRLNQLLRALEVRAAKPARAGTSDRPVVPLAGDDIRPPMAAVVEPAAPEPVATLAPVRPPPVPAGVSVAPAVAAAGLAAGAAALGAASAFGRSRPDEPLSPLQGAMAKDLGLPEAPPADEAAAPPPIPVQALRVDEPAAPDVPEDLTNRSITLPLDLEEELTRALAETSIPPEPVSPPALSPPHEDDRSFEDGLSKLLGRTSKTSGEPSEAPIAQDLADLLEPETSAAHMHETADAAGEGLPAEADPLPVEPLDDDLPAIHASSAAEEERAEQPNETIEEARDEASGEVAMVEPVISQTAMDARNDDDIFNDALSTMSGGDRSWGETPLADQEGAHLPPAPPPQTPVLGTYTIAGRTYRMFGDGSVEAVSEAGEIERFASMEELRKHLARA